MNSILNYLNSNSGAIQALVTLVLVIITWRYVLITGKSLALSKEQFKAILLPQVVPEMKGHGVRLDGITIMHFGQLVITNAGTHFFKLTQVDLQCTCRVSASSEMVPIIIDNFTNQVVPSGSHSQQDFAFKKSLIFHEPHDGECNYQFCFTIEVEDLAGSAHHVYHYDTETGLRYGGGLPEKRHSWWTKQYGRIQRWKQTLDRQIEEINRYSSRDL